MSLLIFLAPIIILLCMSIKIVPQTYVYVVERLGKYHKCCEAGINIIIPVVDRVVNKVCTKEQVLDFPPQPVITKDNVAVRIDSVVFIKIFDPKLYTYGATNPIQGVENLSATTLRNLVGAIEFDNALTSRDEINAQMSSILDDATDEWGIKVKRVEVKNIQPPADILDVMQKQMTAEREKRQAVLEAEGYKQASIMHAEGDKQAKILAAEAERDAQIALAEGRAKSIRLVYEAEAEGIERLNAANISSQVLQLKSIDAMKNIADGNATKVFIPSSLIDTVGNMSLIGESLDLQGATKAAQPAPKADKPYEGIKHENIGSSRITGKVIDAGHKEQKKISEKNDALHDSITMIPR